MQVNLHKNARTTPAIRRELRESTRPTAERARRYGVSPPTVRKWRQRPDGADRSHCPQRLQTTLSPAQESIVVALRRTLLLPLDDLLAVTREFVCEDVSCSGLDRCLRRHGVSDRKTLMPQEDAPKAAPKTFKDYAPGFVHVDLKYLPQMPDEDARRYLFAAIDHRLIKPRHPQTNGMVECFNDRIAEVLATHRLHSGEHLEDTLRRYVSLYNHHIPQRALGHISPVAALQQWYQKKPDLFVSCLNNLPGLDTVTTPGDSCTILRDREGEGRTPATADRDPAL